ncbi:MAG: hypothetical protein V3R94_06315, partial [Acidobacteriota bacterium]
YGLALLFGYVSIHSAVQKLLLSKRPIAEMMGVHLVVAAGLVLMVWAFTIGYSAWCDLRLRRVDQQDQEKILAQRLFYGGILHHVNCGMAVLAFMALLQLSLMSMGMKPDKVGVLSLAAFGLLALFFALATAMYRIPLWSYISLIALGLGVPKLIGLVGFPWPRGPADGIALTALGFLLAWMASRLWRFTQPIIQGTALDFILSPWLDSPQPYPLTTLRHLWARPLLNFSLFLALVGMLLLPSSWEMGLAFPMVATLWLSAGICGLAAWMYRAPILTYLAAGALWMSVDPLLTLAGRPAMEHGNAAILLALVFWAGSLLAEWGFPAPSDSQKTEDKEEPFDGSSVYEVPLTRSAALVSLLAAIQAWSWLEGGPWQPTLLIAYLGAALVLFLSARNMQKAERSTEAVCLVYLAGLCLGTATMTTLSMHWEGTALGVGTAGFSLVLVCVGLALGNNSLWPETGELKSDTLGRLYGEPLVHLALVFPLLAIATVLDHSGLFQVVEMEALATLLLTLGAGAGVTFLLAAVTYWAAVRATGEEIWLHPAIILGGLSVVVLAQGLFQFAPGGFLFITLMVMNLLLGLAHLALRDRDRFNALCGVPGANCEKVLLLWPRLATVGVVLGQGVYFVLIIIGELGEIDPHWSGLGTPLLAALFFLHLFYLEKEAGSVHLLIATSLTGGLWLAALGWLTVDIALALLGLLWLIVAAVLMRKARYGMPGNEGFQLDGEERDRLIQLLKNWVGALLLLSVSLTIPIWGGLAPRFPNTGLSLLLVTFGCMAAGYLWRSAALEAAAAILFLGSVWTTAIWRAGLPEIMPQLGLVTVVLAGGYLFLSRILYRTKPVEGEDSFAMATARGLLGVAVAFTVVSAVMAFNTGMTGPTNLWVALTMVLTACCWLYLAWDHTLAVLVYLSEAAIAWTYLYLFEWVFGVPFGPDFGRALGVVALSFVFFGLNILVVRAGIEKLAVFVGPSYYTALFLPITLWWVIPRQQEPASLVIFAAASFYMMVAHRARAVWALYLPALLYNVALYIWIPEASETTGLLQLYVIPAALTVLIFAHLHKGDLTQEALAGIRIAASAAILAVSTLEVLLSPGLLHFSVELIMTLLAIMLGIAFRIRAFVYTGFAFLVIGVTSQLSLQIQDQAGIARAVILIAVGMMVLMAMVFFNIKREEILRQYRYFMMSPEWE